MHRPDERDDAPDLSFWLDAPDHTPAGRLVRDPYDGPERRRADRCKWCNEPPGRHRLGCELRSRTLSPTDVRCDDVRVEDVDPRDDLP